MAPPVPRHLSVVAIGHSNHGKSTLCGRLCLLLGAFDPRVVDLAYKETEEVSSCNRYPLKFHKMMHISCSILIEN